jgi:predicted dehydrogenase
MASLSARDGPIRVAIVGLSSSAVTSWASGAHLPCLKAASGLSRYKIAALCNSSVSAAKLAVKSYDLGVETKAYGNPDDLAKDPDIDFVLCNTRVDKHYETILPSIKAGKDVYIEWPIASNQNQIEKLVVAAKESGSKALVGLQGRWAPPVLKIKEILSQGLVGKLLSCDVRAYGGSKDREILPAGLKYFAQRQVGGNPITIGFGHGSYNLRRKNHLYFPALNGRLTFKPAGSN